MAMQVHVCIIKQHHLLTATLSTPICKFIAHMCTYVYSITLQLSTITYGGIVFTLHNKIVTKLLWPHHYIQQPCHKLSNYVVSYNFVISVYRMFSLYIYLHSIWYVRTHKVSWKICYGYTSWQKI